jgi:hypothetical protein
MVNEVSGEERLIARYFRPLAKHPAALGLLDDAAALEPPAGCDLVLKTDGLIGGVHFFPDDPQMRWPRPLTMHWFAPASTSGTGTGGSLWMKDRISPSAKTTQRLDTVSLETICCCVPRPQSMAMDLAGWILREVFKEDNLVRHLVGG